MANAAMLAVGGVVVTITVKNLIPLLVLTVPEVLVLIILSHARVHAVMIERAE